MTAATFSRLRLCGCPACVRADHGMDQGVADEFTINNSAGPLSALKWPVFKWSGGREDHFFARLQKGEPGSERERGCMMTRCTRIG